MFLAATPPQSLSVNRIAFQQMETFLNSLKTELLKGLSDYGLSFTAAALIICHVANQLLASKKLWHDAVKSQHDAAKSELDVKKGEIELRELQKQDTQIADPASPGSKVPEEEISRDRLQVLTRHELFIVLFMVVSYFMLIWRGSHIANDRQLFSAILNALILVITFHILLLNIAFRFVSCMFVENVKHIADLLIVFQKYTAKGLLDSDQFTSRVMLELHKEASDRLFRVVSALIPSEAHKDDLKRVPDSSIAKFKEMLD